MFVVVVYCPMVSLWVNETYTYMVLIHYSEVGFLMCHHHERQWSKALYSGPYINIAIILVLPFPNPSEGRLW